MSIVVLPAQAIPQSNEGFYAINNPFQETGPKGFTESKILENGDLFKRIDLPGVSEEHLMLSIHPSKRNVIIKAFAPIMDVKDSNPRWYYISCRIFCPCCEISNVTHDLSHGVLRLLISKKPITLGATCPYISPSLSNPYDPKLTGPEIRPHPNLKEGPIMAYEYTQLTTGGLYVRVDMPGVPKDSFTVSVTNGRVRVSGQAPAYGYDSAGRFYSGDVAVLSPPIDLHNRWIRTSANDGVIRLHIYTPL